LRRRHHRNGTVRAMLSRYGLLDVDWFPLPHGGYSGAKLLTCRDSARNSWVLKRSCRIDDWIMKATGDEHGREAQFARARLLQSGRVRSAAVDGAQDGVYSYTLMRDISRYMFVGDIDRSSTESLVRGMAQLHATSFDAPGDVWCGLEDRLLLLSRGVHTLRRPHDTHGLVDQVRAGWHLFDTWAPKGVRDLINELKKDVEILLPALRPLPTTSLHGDLKLDNLGLDHEGVLWLIDWALAVRGPVCVELGWFIAANSQRGPST
jgi:hypothetical protein